MERHSIKSIDDIGFASDDETWIVNPTASSCSRFFVADPEEYGFQWLEYGGNCSGWRKDLHGGLYLVLTDEHGQAAAYEPGDRMLLGLYDESADHGGAIACKTLLAGVVESHDDDNPHSRLI